MTRSSPRVRGIAASKKRNHDRQPQVLISHSRWRRAGAEPGDAARRRFCAGRLFEAADRHRLHLEHDDALQHAHRRSGRGSSEGRGCRRGKERRIQHHHRLRRHRHGHVRDALFAGLPGVDRGFHRSCRRRAGIRWFRCHRRLRQEHAGMRHGDGAPGSAERIRIRRHDPARRRASRHHLGVRSRRRSCWRDRIRHRTQGDRADGDSGPRFMRRHVHREHHGLRDRSPGPLPAELVGAKRGQRKQAPRQLRRGCRGEGADRPRHQAFGHSFPRGVRECDYRVRSARRFDQRRPAPACHCPCR